MDTGDDRPELRHLLDGGIDPEHPWACDKARHARSRKALCLICFRRFGEVEPDLIRKNKARSRANADFRQATKETLQKVMYALPTYKVNDPRLPTGICNEDRHLVRKFSEQVQEEFDESSGRFRVKDRLTMREKARLYEALDHIAFLSSRKPTRFEYHNCRICEFGRAPKVQRTKRKARQDSRESSSFACQAPCCATRANVNLLCPMQCCAVSGDTENQTPPAPRKKQKYGAHASTPGAPTTGESTNAGFTTPRAKSKPLAEMSAPNDVNSPVATSYEWQTFKSPYRTPKSLLEHADMMYTPSGKPRPTAEPDPPQDEVKETVKPRFMYSHKDMMTIQARTRCTDSQMLEWAKCLRHLNKDRALIEPHLEDAFLMRNKKFEHFFSIHQFAQKKDSSGAPTPETGRAGVVCNDLDGFFNAVLEERSKTLEEVDMIKVGIDGGRGSLKACASIIFEGDKEESDDDSDDDAPNESSSPSRLTYDDALTATAKFKDDGVRRVVVLGVIPTDKSNTLEVIKEDRSIVEELVNCIGLSFQTTALKVKLCLDLKVINILLGIQKHSCTYPCYLCLWEKGSDSKRVILRTAESIKRNHEKWESSGASRADLWYYKSCHDKPLDIFMGAGDIIELIPPPELHIFLGISNLLVNALPDVLQTKWFSDSHGVNVTRPKYHGGDLLGPDCKKLLESTEKLRELIRLCELSDEEKEKAEETADLISCFRNVVHGCFSKELRDGWEEAIKDFGKKFRQSDLTISTKVHIVLSHVPKFCKKFGALGKYNEQALESVHADFRMRAWDKHSIRNLDAKGLGKRLLQAVLEYNGMAVS